MGRRTIIDLPAHQRTAVRLQAANGQIRDALAAADLGFDVDDLTHYVWSGTPTIPKRYVGTLVGITGAAILLGYEIGVGGRDEVGR